MLGFHKETKDPAAAVPAEPASSPGARVSAAHVPSKKLGQILVEDGVISASVLEDALEQQSKSGGFIGQILVEKGVAKQSDILLSLVKQCKIPHLSLLDYEISKDVSKLIPQEVCVRCNLIPIDKLGRILTVAMVNPLDDEALEEVRRACPDLRIKPILCDWKHFETVLGRVFNLSRPMSSPPAPEPPQPDGASSAATAAAAAAATAVEKPQPAQPVVANEEAVQAAMDEAVNQVIMTAATELRPMPAVQNEAAPDSDNLKQSIQETILGAMQEALASVSVQMKAQPLPQLQSPDPSELVQSVRQEVCGALREAVEPLMEQLAAATQSPQASAAPTDLSATLKEAVRDALRENESQAVARANLRDLETRDQERRLGDRHASVSHFASGKQDAVAHKEDDARVLFAMDCDRLLDGYTFDCFCVGNANSFTHKICMAVAENPGAEYNPLFIYGDVGLGKTHLINATGNAILHSTPDVRVGYVSSSRFATRLAEAVQERAVNVFRENYSHWDVLILDDIQFLGGRVEAQEEFFHIFNVLQQEGRQIIIASDKAPDRLGMLEQRLVSRFASGIVVNLKPPEYETRTAILRRQIQQNGDDVSDEIVSLVAMRVPSDIRKMLGALRKLQAFTKLEGTKLTFEVASEILSHLGFHEAA